MEVERGRQVGLLSLSKAGGSLRSQAYSNNSKKSGVDFGIAAGPIQRG